MILPFPNPIVKIAFALYTAIYVIESAGFGLIVYFYSIVSNPKEENERKRGLIIQLMSLPPRLITILLQFLLDIVVAISKKLNLLDKYAKLKVTGLLLTYIVITLRKILFILSWAYITPEDSAAVHSRSFLLFCITSSIHQWFIITLSDSLNNKSQTKGRVSFMQNIKDLLPSYRKSQNFHPARQMEFLQFKRKFYYYISWIGYAVVFYFVYKSQLETDTINYWLALMKPLELLVLFFDMQFKKTYALELNGLNLKMVNFAENHYMV